MTAQEWIERLFANELGARAPSEERPASCSSWRRPRLTPRSASRRRSRATSPGATGVPLSELRRIADGIGGGARHGGRVRVAELWRYPVKSMRGEPLERAEVLADGVGATACCGSTTSAAARSPRGASACCLASTPRSATTASRSSTEWRGAVAAALERIRERAAGRACRSRAPTRASASTPRRSSSAPTARSGRTASIAAGFGRTSSLSGVDGPRGARLDRQAPAPGIGDVVRRGRALRALRGDDDRPGHARRRPRSPAPHPPRVRRDHGRVLRGRRAWSISVDDPVEVVV